MSNAFAVPGIAVEIDDLMGLRHLGRAMGGRAPTRLTALPGGFVGKRRGRGLDVHDIRAWQYGDEIRHLDHNATARTGVPYTRTFRDERESTLLLVADFRPSMLFGTRTAFRSVAAARLLALEGWRMLAEGGKVGAMALAGEEDASVIPARGTRAMIDTVATLVRAHAIALDDPAVQDRALDSCLERAARLVPHGAAIVVATSLDTPGVGFPALAAWLSRRNALRFILLRDAFERRPAPGHYAFVTAAGGRGSISVDRRPPARDTRLDELRRLGATCVCVDADAGVEDGARALAALHV